jgi:hypothetical protein
MALAASLGTFNVCVYCCAGTCDCAGCDPGTWNTDDGLPLCCSVRPVGYAAKTLEQVLPGCAEC